MAAACAAAGCGGSEDAAGCRDGAGDATAVFAATGVQGGPAPEGAMEEAVRVICERARERELTVSVRREGRDRIAIGVAGDRRRELRALTAPGQLVFYDWEPNLFSGPQPVNDLDQAVSIAARSKPRVEDTDVPGGDRANDTIGDKYYSLDADRNLIASTRPRASGAERVPRGVVIVRERFPEGATEHTPAQFHVLEDDAELSGADIRNPKQDFDQQTQEPIVAMEFTDRGRAAFARVTRRLAKRGQETLPQPGQAPDDRFQRFAIVLDGHIVSKATVDFIRNPEGISGSTGAQINGIGSTEDTKALADSLRIGPLPVRLEPAR